MLAAACSGVLVMGQSGLGCASADRARVRTAERGSGGAGQDRTGLASHYSDALAGRPTASGEPYDPSEATCAHRELPFGTRLLVTDVRTERTVECRVNDRGPFVRGRIVDLSRSAAEQLGIIEQGLARVRIRVVRD